MDKIRIGVDGSLQFPEDYRRRFNLKPGDEVLFTETDGGMSISPMNTPLQKVIVEPTALCNLSCPACNAAGATFPNPMRRIALAIHFRHAATASGPGALSCAPDGVDQLGRLPAFSQCQTGIETCRPS